MPMFDKYINLFLSSYSITTAYNHLSPRPIIHRRGFLSKTSGTHWANHSQEEMGGQDVKYDIGV